MQITVQLLVTADLTRFSVCYYNTIYTDCKRYILTEIVSEGVFFKNS